MGLGSDTWRRGKVTSRPCLDWGSRGSGSWATLSDRHHLESGGGGETEPVGGGGRLKQQGPSMSDTGSDPAQTATAAPPGRETAICTRSPHLTWHAGTDLHTWPHPRHLSHARPHQVSWVSGDSTLPNLRPAPSTSPTPHCPELQGGRLPPRHSPVVLCHDQMGAVSCVFKAQTPIKFPSWPACLTEVEPVPRPTSPACVRVWR